MSFVQKHFDCESVSKLNLLVLLVLAALPACAQEKISTQPDARLRAAICPIVYPYDKASGSKGFRFTFFGNAFFINSQGYLVTAAHVLQTFRDNGQPYILVDRPNAPPQTLKANIVAVDWIHDVAVLRATPNPFEGKFRVGFLPLASSRPAAGDAVVATALHPANIRTAATYQMPIQDWSSAQVLGFVQTREDPNLPETDLFLFSHDVQLGQSGSPVLLASSHEVAGLVDGRWLRPSTFSLPAKSGGASERYSGPLGAAVPIDFLLALLQKNSISWTPAAAPKIQ
jgi:Trypsin-like peptidase domain